MFDLRDWLRRAWRTRANQPTRTRARRRRPLFLEALEDRWVPSAVAPTLTLNPVAAIDENGVATLTGTIADADTADTFTLTVNWGDPLSPSNAETYPFPASATGSQNFTLTHQYLDDNPTSTGEDDYTIGVTVVDDDGGTIAASTPVTVRNVLVSNLVLNGPFTVSENSPVNLQGSFTDPGTLDTHRVTIRWGDGTANTVLNLAANVLTFSATHAYADDGPSPGNGIPADNYTLTVTVSDDDGSRGGGGTGQLTEQEPNDTRAQAQLLDSAGWSLASDPDIGDDSTNTSTTIPHLTIFGTGNNTVDLYSFTIEAVGSRGIFDLDYGMPDFDSYLRLFDDTGAVLAQRDDYSPPSVGQGGSTHGYDSYIDYTFSAAGTYYIEVGRCCVALPIPNGADYRLQVSLQNVDPGSVATTQVTVNNVAPAAGGLTLSPLALTSSRGVVLSGSLTDAGTRDAHTVTVNWGDGSLNTVQNLGTGIFNFTGLTHTYRDDGPTPGTGTGSDVYTVTVTIADDDAGVGTPATIGAFVGTPSTHNTFARALNLGTLAGSVASANMELLSGQYAYYQFTTTATAGEASQVAITAAYATVGGQLELYLFDAAGNMLARSTVADAARQAVSLNGLPAGSYTFLAYEAGSYNWYSFLVDTAPASPAVPDRFEPNNTPATAADLGVLTTAQTLTGLTLLDHYDYYTFTLAAPAGADSRLQVTATQLGAEPLGLGLYLYNAAGDLLDLRTPPVPNALMPLNNLPAGTYTLLVYGLRASPAYTLTLDPGTTAPLLDDTYGPNDTPATAADLGALYGRLTLTGLSLATSRDFYRFALPFDGNAASEVRLRTDPAQGAISLYLFGPDGSLLTLTQGASGDLALSLRGRPAGTYHVLVTEGLAQAYTLILDPGLGPYPDDTFEAGNTVDTAADLGTLSSATTLANLVMSDWYDLFRFTTTAPGGAASEVRLTTDHSRGLLDLYLLDAAGAVLAYAPGELALAQGSGSSTAVTRVLLATRPAGTYGVLVYGRIGANPSYSLTIDPLAGGSLSDDRYEPNDQPPAAADLGTLSTNQAVTGLVLADQYDFYRFTLANPAPGNARVTVTLAASAPTFDLYLFDATGLVAISQHGSVRGRPTTGQLSLAGRRPGTYTLLVYAPGVIADYRLDFTVV